MKTISLFTFRVLSILIVVSFLGIGSCKKKATDPDYCGTTWTTQVTSQSNALTTALQTYAANQTPANCTALKTAYQNYVNALEPFVDCASWTAQQSTELQNAINDAQQQINTLCQ
jgi:hypothetical protein